MRKRKLIQINATESLYQKLEEVRKKFKEINGVDMTLIQATDFFGRKVRVPKIPNLLKNEKNKQKGRRY